MTPSTDLLILGGSGPIGREIARIASYRSVISVSRRGPVRLDVNDAHAVDALLSQTRPRAIVYLVNDAAMSPELAESAFDGTLRAARRRGVERVVFASSSAVYGDRGDAPYREDDVLQGGSDYALVKMRCEGMLAAADLPVSSSLRIFNVFGPGCTQSLVNRLGCGPTPSLRWSDQFVRDYVHVTDVARAFLSAARGDPVHGPFNIARGRGVHNLQLAEAAGPEAYKAASDVGPRSYSVADVSRAHLALGWRALMDPLRLLRTRTALCD